jgi:NADPH-dependent 2,4-dienoyl-CoA reductase/sulfur reductase-like enzyme
MRLRPTPAVLVRGGDPPDLPQRASAEDKHPAKAARAAFAFVRDEREALLRLGWKVPVDAAPTGKRVLVVGAGPSGLSAACHLTRLGQPEQT